MNFKWFWRQESLVECMLLFWRTPLRSLAPISGGSRACVTPAPGGLLLLSYLHSQRQSRAQNPHTDTHTQIDIIRNNPSKCLNEKYIKKSCFLNRQEDPLFSLNREEMIKKNNKGLITLKTDMFAPVLWDFTYRP